MSAALVPWPRRALATVVICLAAVAAMGVAFHNKDHGTGFDDSVDTWIRARNADLGKLLIHITDPAEVIVLFAVLILWAGFRRRWRVVVFAVITPLVTIGLVEEVLKPWVNRRPQGSPALLNAIFGGHIPRAYPSGHESGIGSFLAVCVVLVLASTWTIGARLGALAGLLLVALTASFALVARYYHYATDTIGSIFFCIAVALVVGLIIDVLVPPVPYQDRHRYRGRG